MRHELVQLPIIHGACRQPTSDAEPDEALIAECIQNSEAPIRAAATRKCQLRAKQAIEAAVKLPTETSSEVFGESLVKTFDEDSSVAVPSAPPSASRSSSGRSGQQTNSPVPTPTDRPTTPRVSSPTSKEAPQTASRQTAKSNPGDRNASGGSSSAAKTAPKDSGNSRSATTESVQAARDSAQYVAPQVPDVADADASADIALCENSYAVASRCCGNPTACLGSLSSGDQARYAQIHQQINTPPTQGQGLSQYCQQMQQLGGSGGDANVMLAGICSNKQLGCSSVCGQLVQKYQSLVGTCAGCASGGIYQQALATLQSRQYTCDGYSRRVSAIANQAFGGGSAAAYANTCSQIASANPQNGGSPANISNSSGSNSSNQGGGANAPNDPFGCAANPNSAACQNCSRNPSSPACRALASSESKGTADFGVASRESSAAKGRFNLDMPTDSEGEAPMGPLNIEPQATMTNAVIANNSGGAMPGGGDTSAKLGPAPRPSPGSPGYSTDIMQGLSSPAGYSSVANQFGSYEEPAPNFRVSAAKSAARKDEGERMIGMDLKQYLPGGRLDPQRRIAGIGGRGEINAKEEDIWRRISLKMVEKCKLGLLVGCR